jgi:competence ComEA-like helix-hairpin-helix protein
MFELTEEERMAVIFVSAMVLAGLCFDFLAHRFWRIDKPALFNANLCKIELNSAGIEELQKIKGIGQKTAQRIIEYRENKGRIYFVEELREIRGLQGRRFKNLKDAVFIK